MDKVLKRVTNHKKHNNSYSPTVGESNNSCCNSGRICTTSSTINKRYSVDDNFYVSRHELRENLNENNFYTLSHRDRLHSSINRRRSRTTGLSDRQHSTSTASSAQKNDDPSFKKLFKVFNSASENSRNAKDWLVSSANNVRELAPKILSRKFRNSKNKDNGNELYRSNSFRFEKFERNNSTDTFNSKGSPTVSRQIVILGCTSGIAHVGILSRN